MSAWDETAHDRDTRGKWTEMAGCVPEGVLGAPDSGRTGWQAENGTAWLGPDDRVVLDPADLGLDDGGFVQHVTVSRSDYDDTARVRATASIDPARLAPDGHPDPDGWVRNRAPAIRDCLEESYGGRLNLDLDGHGGNLDDAEPGTPVRVGYSFTSSVELRDHAYTPAVDVAGQVHRATGQAAEDLESGKLPTRVRDYCRDHAVAAVPDGWSPAGLGEIDREVSGRIGVRELSARTARSLAWELEGQAGQGLIPGVGEHESLTALEDLAFTGVADKEQAMGDLRRVHAGCRTTAEKERVSMLMSWLRHGSPDE